jgi:hypothetical protein
MDTEAFWRVLGAAMDSDKPLNVAVVDHLSALPAEEILAFEARFCRLRDAVYRWDVWAAAGDQGVIFDEDFTFVSATAYERLTGDSDAFWKAWAAHTDTRATTEEDDSEGMGESFDFDDAQQMRRRLPRLAALHLGPGPG